ncbi:hypothetical protein HQ533_03965 [Candidatus Woesearchaeota archaeon]|nr:hypothetical protein [Candidatus Woesearchaeota archaeon]
MNKIAVDIVLLPSEEMMDKAIEINKKLLKNNEPKIVLNKENCLPHMSLCMGVIDEKDVELVGKELTTISKRFSAFDLSFNELFTSDLGFTELSSNKPDDLQLLHETITVKLAKFMTYNATSDMLLLSDGEESFSAGWISGYHNNASFENFSPHVTVGYGVPVVDLPINFTASKLAICHIGNYCTCRKLLFEKTL